MRTVNISGLARELGGRQPVPATFTFQYWAGGGEYTAVEGAEVVFAPKITVKTDTTAPSATVPLEETGGKCCVRITGRSGRFTMDDLYVEIPAGTDPVDVEDLPRVDPDSFAPATVTPSLLDTIQAQIAAATFDRF